MKGEGSLTNPSSSLGQRFSSRLPAGAHRYVGFRSALELLGGTAGLLLLTLLVVDDVTRLVIIVVIVSLALLSLAIEIPILDRLRVASTSYDVSPESVTIARGVFVRTITVIPVTHIVNLQIVHGPVLRFFGYVAVRFTTIAGSPTLGPLLADEAETIRLAVILSDRAEQSDD